jgi:micrococcal nuclease
MKKSLLVLVIVLIIILGIVVEFTSKEGDVVSGSSEYRVLRVIDGDTIEVERIGKVRYIGVDSPETKHPSKNEEPYGREAFEANRRLVEDKRVRLELDVGERDRYGRVLAYVYVGDVFVNAWLVANGYAQVMTVPPNVKYADLFVKLEQDAREAAKGLWGIPKDRTEEAEEGYWASSRSNKFHWSSCRWARKISPRNLVVFENREEALKADYIPCKECKP